MKKGFTLIELLIVVSIIGILSTVVVSVLNEGRVRAKDVKSISNLSSIQKSLEMYYLDHGTYAIPGTGYNGEGHGYLTYSDGVTYPISPAEQLVNEGYLSQNTHMNIVSGGYNENINYLIYHCNDGQKYSLSASLSAGSRYINTAELNTMCAGAWVISNGKNYGISNI